MFVFQPDDISQIRDMMVRTVRDNVVFELGMFIAVLGKERVFFLIPKGSEDIHLPTDLIGVERGHYVPPECEEDLLAALGQFCNRVRRQIVRVWKEEGKLPPTLPHISYSANDEKPDKANDEQTGKAEEEKNVEYGVQVDRFGNYTISIGPGVFFANRVSAAFPGIRDLYWFTDGKQALDRLQILLRAPLTFENTVGHATSPNRIWWWRAGCCAPISVFRRLSDTKCLMDIHELEISKIAVYHRERYYHTFVYVEVSPDLPTELYPSDEAVIRHRIEAIGYASEEYGLFQNIPITRECYDDGAAVIDGVVVDLSGGELRVRYLSRYNFLIASQLSSINSHEFDTLSEPLLADMLSGQDRLEELCTVLQRLPRHKLGG